MHQEEGYVRDFLLIALFTGMRRSEIARLRWEFIDLDGRTLTVNEARPMTPREGGGFNRGPRTYSNHND